MKRCYCGIHFTIYIRPLCRAGFFASTRDECLPPRVRLECNPQIPVAPGEEHWLLDTSLDEVYWPCSHSRAMPSYIHYLYNDRLYRLNPIGWKPKTSFTGLKARRKAIFLPGGFRVRFLPLAFSSFWRVSPFLAYRFPCISKASKAASLQSSLRVHFCLSTKAGRCSLLLAGIYD